MSDLSGVVDLNDPAVREQLGLEERTLGGVPESSENQPTAFHRVRDKLSETLREKALADQELAQTRRELAIERAALPDFAGKGFFIQNYQGEASAEAIRQAATDAGFALTAAPAPVVETVAQVPASELEMHSAVAAVAAGSTGNGDIPLDQAMLAARSPEELMRILEQAPTDAGLAIKSNIL